MKHTNPQIEEVLVSQMDKFNKSIPKWVIVDTKTKRKN